MSTKTTIKRIALVAVAALGLGVLTVAPSSAAAAPSLSATTATVTTGTYNTYTLTAGTNDKVYTISSSGVGSVFYPTAPATTVLQASGSSQVWASTGAAGTGAVGANTFVLGTEQLAFSVYSATAGSQTITVTGDSTAAFTLTLTWQAAAATSVALSTSGMSAGVAAVTQNTNATVVASSAVQTAAANRAATIAVVVNDQYGAPRAARTLTATISGPGNLAFSGTAGGVAQGRAITGGAGDYTVYVFADGNAGASTVNIYDGTTLLATKTVTFYGAPAKVEATNNNFVVANGILTGGAVELYVTDAAGNPVSGQAANLSGTSSDSTVIASTNGCVADGATGAGYYVCDVTAASALTATSGKSASLTYVVKNVAGTVLATSNAVSVSIGGTTIASITATTDSSSYAPGEKVTLTLTAKDSSGNAVADGTYGIWRNSGVAAVAIEVPFAPSSSITTNPFSLAVGKFGYAFSKGVSSATFYAPYTDGTVTLNSTTGAAGSGLATALQAKALTATFTVSTSAAAAIDAANEATDAANAATDAANAAAEAADAATAAAQDAQAAVAELATQVAALIAGIKAQITTLTNLVIKIQKKVKA